MGPFKLSKAGLDSLIARGVAPAPEIYLLANDTKPPVSDQFTGGIRTSVRGILVTASYAGIRAQNGLTYEFANRGPDGTCCLPIPGYSNVLIARDVKKTWYDALFVTADRPFRDRWGFSLAYTLAQGEQSAATLQLRLPDGRGLPAASDPGRRAPSHRRDRNRPAPLRSHVEQPRHVDLGPRVHGARRIAGSAIG